MRRWCCLSSRMRRRRAYSRTKVGSAKCAPTCATFVIRRYVAYERQGARKADGRRLSGGGDPATECPNVAELRQMRFVSVRPEEEVPSAMFSARKRTAKKLTAARPSRGQRMPTITRDST